MALKISLISKEVLKGLTVVVTGVQARKPSQQYDNSKDVKEYPYMLRVTVTQDINKVNTGQSFTIKLKDSGSLAVGQMLNLDKFILKNGHASLWANQRGYVQVSLKGDALDAR